MKKKHGKTAQITEEITDWAESIQVFREDGSPPIIRNAVLLGAVSKNADGSVRRIYSKAVHEAAVGKFDGRQMYFDHGKMSRSGIRSVRDLVGVVRASRVDDQGRTRGNLHLAEGEEAGKVAWFAEHQPSALGLSPHIQGRRRIKGQVEIVESIDFVHSVDFVTRPATTDGLFEDQDQSERGDFMNWEEVTLDDLRKNCPAIVEAIQGEAEGTAELQRLKAENVRLASEIAEAQKSDREGKVSALLEGLQSTVQETLRDAIGEDMPLEKAEAMVKAFRESLGDPKPKSSEKSTKMAESKSGGADKDKAASSEQIGAAFSA